VSALILTRTVRVVDSPAVSRTVTEAVNVPAVG
jgi:hypothetical protein